MTVLRYCAAACVESGLGGALFVQQGAGVEHGLRHIAGQCPEGGAGRHEQLADLGRRPAPGLAVSVNCGSRLAMATPIVGAGGMQLGLGGADIGALLDELRRAG